MHEFASWLDHICQKACSKPLNSNLPHLCRSGRITVLEVPFAAYRNTYIKDSPLPLSKRHTRFLWGMYKDSLCFLYTLTYFERLGSGRGFDAKSPAKDISTQVPSFCCGNPKRDKVKKKNIDINLISNAIAVYTALCFLDKLAKYIDIIKGL